MKPFRVRGVYRSVFKTYFTRLKRLKDSRSQRLQSRLLWLGAYCPCSAEANDQLRIAKCELNVVEANCSEVLLNSTRSVSVMRNVTPQRHRFHAAVAPG